MEGFSTDSLYNDLLGFSDTLKTKPAQELEYSLDNNYREPVNNFMTDDGIYSSMGMGGAPMNYSTPSPMNFDTSSPMMNYSETLPEMSYDSGYPDGQELGQVLTMSKEMEDVMNSLLIDNDNFPLLPDQSNFELDVAAAQWNDNDDDTLDLLGTGYGATGGHNTNYGPAPTLDTIPNSPSPVGHPQKRRKPRKVKNVQTIDESAIMASPPHMYPQPEELGIPSSPCSSSSYSDAGSSNDERPRQRRPRVSYNTLTEEERYKRIRDLNNEASRNYRERQRTVYTELEKQLPGLLEKNKHLQNKYVGLQKLRDQMEQYSRTFLSQHMSAPSQHMSNPNFSGL